MEDILSKFDEYAKSFDMSDPMIALKYFHSYRVMEICKKIAVDMKFSEEEINIAMIIGILHDYGRFKQWDVYKTYYDLASIDHGDLGVKILFDNNEIEKFNIDKKYYNVIYDSIKYHNKYSCPDNISEKSKLFCKLIKDADKLDIFYSIKIGDIKLIDDTSEISKTINDEFYKEKLLKKEDRKTKSDLVVFYLAMIFDLNYKYSYQYLKENNLIEGLFENMKSKEKFEPYVQYVKKYMKEGN